MHQRFVVHIVAAAPCRPYFLSYPKNTMPSTLLVCANMRMRRICQVSKHTSHHPHSPPPLKKSARSPDSPDSDWADKITSVNAHCIFPGFFVEKPGPTPHSTWHRRVFLGPGIVGPSCLEFVSVNASLPPTRSGEYISDPNIHHEYISSSTRTQPFIGDSTGL
jgi:hypothetical protein